MPYCDLDDLKQDISGTELQQLTDDERLGAVNEDRINAAIGAAGDLIDGFLRGRYALPLDPVPTIVRTIATEIAIYRLFLRKKRQTITKEMTDNYNAQIRLLEKLQRGEITLGGGETPSEKAGEGSYRTNRKSTDRTFSKDVLEKM